MKTSIKTLVLMTAMIITASFSATAMDMHHSGETIRETKVKGISLTYQIIDMRESMKKMEGNHDMGAMATHHLMVVAKDSKGPIKGKAGFVVIGPDGKKANAMAMAMGDGFGADVHLSAPGDYTIKAKVMGEGQSLKDEFTYTLKK